VEPSEQPENSSAKFTRHHVHDALDEVLFWFLWSNDASVDFK
jgi:hypothetical protein